MYLYFKESKYEYAYNVRICINYILYSKHVTILTSKYEQYVHTNDTNNVANIPVISPEHWKASGIARMPVPKEALSK